MSNPFVFPGSILAERERRRRQRLKFCVYSAVILTSALLVGLLIEGCRAQKIGNESVLDKPAEVSSGTVRPGLTDAAEIGPRLAELPPPTNSVMPGDAILPADVTLPTATQSETTRNPKSPSTPPRLKPLPPSLPSPTASRKYYIVKPGDTLLRVAKAHHTTVNELKEINHLKNDRLLVGEELLLARAGLHSHPLD